MSSAPWFTLPTEDFSTNKLQTFYTYFPNFKMNQSTVFVVAFGIVAIICISSAMASTIPFINCEEKSLADAPTKIRQLCYYVLEQLHDQPQDNGEILDGRLYERGIKRQDVDHVFLRFGRRF